MLYTLCQRLIENPRIGFDYDYMGAAEYEFGATRQAREYLAAADEIVVTPGAVQVNGSRVECAFHHAVGDATRIADLKTALYSGDYHNKGVMAYTGRDIFGWLCLDPVPCIIHPDQKGLYERARKFLEHGKTL